MHPIRISLAFLFIALSSMAKAQNQKLDGPFLVKKVIKVYGVCDMCKGRIEKIAKKVPGVTYAHWDADAQTLLVQFLRTRTNPNKIQESIAAGGHDTEKVKAEDAVYEALPDCCHYRTASE